ncbi:MAG: hypothetical protein HYV97_19835 [Bdellovibrio sp.]|nr:hypothetical protein [Bdellovibrio sp.]
MVKKILTYLLCLCLNFMQMFPIDQAMAEDAPQTDPHQGNCDGSGNANCDTVDKDIEASVRKNNPGMSEEEIQAETKRLQELFKNDKNSGTIIDMGSGKGEGSGGGLSATYSTPEFHTLMVAIATGVLGIPFGFTCVNQSSAITFGNASLGFIIGWVVEIGKIKKASERRLSILTNVNAELVSAQVEAINVAIQQTEDAAKQAGTFGDIMMYTSIFYGIAASLAFSEGFIAPLDMCPQSTVLHNTSILRQNLFEALFQSLGISQAYAEDNPFASLGIENQLKDIFIEILAEVKTAFSSSANNGMVRGVAMSVFADNDYDAMNIIKDRKARLEERVRIYKELLKQLKAISPTPPVKISDGKASSSTGSTGDVTISNSQELQGIDTLQGSCATGDPQNLPLKADLECKDKPIVVEDKSNNIPVNTVIDIPGGVVGGVKNSREYANNLASGRPTSNELRQYDQRSFATFKEIKNEIGSKLIDYSKKHKKKLPISSIEDAEKEFREKLMKSVALVVSKYQPASLNSMMGQFMGSDSPEVKKVSALIEEKNLKKPIQPGSMATEGVPKIKLDNDSMTKAKIKTKSDSGPEFTSADALQNLNYTENDITKDTGASLFLILSNRYRKTAYPLLFEKQ